MEIFNVQLNGEDVTWFCNLTRTEKVEWIKNNTNQYSDEIIETFLSSKPIFSKARCIECSSKKEKISIEAIVEKTTTKKSSK